MRFCINHQCHQPQNSDSHTFCSSCDSQLLINNKYYVVSQRSKSLTRCTYDVQLVVDNSPELGKILHVFPIENLSVISRFQQLVTELQSFHHPSIPSITEDGYFTYLAKNTTTPLHCYITNKISGITLDKYMRRQDDHPVDEQLVCQWLKEVVNILQVLHSQNILHLAINPQKILLKDDGNLALIDILNANNINPDHGVEYSPYIPPEQFNNSPVIQSDFFAVGVTFAYLLTGKEAEKNSGIYQSDDPQIKWQNFIPPTNQLSELPKLIDAMMASAPVKRPENSPAILQILDQLTENSPEVSSNQNSPNKNQFILLFTLNWALATFAGTSIGGSIGFFAGYCASFLIGSAAKNISTGILWGGIIFGLITGLTTSLMQSWVLLQFNYQVKYWIFLTTLGFTIEATLGALISNYDYSSKIFLTPGVVLGIIQFLTLRIYIKHSLLWIIANIFAGIMGIWINLEIPNIPIGKYQIFSHFIALIIFGIVTGVSLIKLTKDGSTLVAQKSTS